jgi:2-phospho-L-lactate transferase/gluconeogenesis factor (CofD/UPF0052 family)
VAVGGGHGLDRTLRALSRVVDDVTAVVTVADDGGSSGRLRRDLGVLPPGDLRMAVAALAADEDLARLLQYRFDRGELGGHSLGNLILVALQDLADGDVVRALRQLGSFLGIRGRVVPCTLTPVTLHGRTTEGPVRGRPPSPRHRVCARSGSKPMTAAGRCRRRPARSMPSRPATWWCSDRARSTPACCPTCSSRGSPKRSSPRPAPVVLVANLREQPGETEGLSLRDHLDALDAHVPELRIDALVAHAGPAPRGGGHRCVAIRARSRGGSGRC